MLSVKSLAQSAVVCPGTTSHAHTAQLSTFAKGVYRRFIRYPINAAFCALTVAGIVYLTLYEKIRNSVSKISYTLIRTGILCRGTWLPGFVKYFSI